MEKAEFLKELEDILQREEECKATDELASYDEWDSLSKMSIMAYYDKNFDVKLSLNDFKSLNTVSDLIKLAGDKIQ
jgi:putative acyl carrier protein